mmetsp:Transcript_10893/g.8096  ORF Transcript_10893/g.8096 Transcript_10893/m.8096 type:complete len:159 (+) Transcript_10893:397-873(+)
MFLVELAHNTIKEEIEELEKKCVRKEIALKDSSNQLEQDNVKLMKFIENDNITKQEKEKQADNLMKERRDKESKIKAIDSKIQNLKSEIDKNKDILAGLEEHKKFLITISPPQWVAEKEQKKMQKRQMIKKAWIDYHKKHKDDDHLIFPEDEELYSSV